MARGVYTLIPRTITVTAYTAQRNIEHLEAWLASTANGYGASMIGVENALGHFVGTDLETILEEIYTDATTGAGTFTDTFNFYAVDQVGPAFDALGVAIGGTNSVTRTYNAGGPLTSDETVVTSLGALNDEFLGSTFTLNQDAAAGTGETCTLILQGGNGVAAVRSAQLVMAPAASLAYMALYEGGARISADFQLGFPGDTTVSLDSTLTFNAATDGGVARQATTSYLGQENRLDITLPAGGEMRSAQQITSQEGVAGGTVRRLSGTLYRSSVASTPITSTGGADAETVFSTGTVTIPANTIVAGTWLHVRAVCAVMNGVSAATLFCRARMNGVAGTILATTTGHDVATNNTAVFDIYFVGTEAPAAAAMAGGHSTTYDWGVPGAPNLIYLPVNGPFATDGALDLVVTGQWHGGGAGDQVRLGALLVEIMG